MIKLKKLDHRYYLGIIIIALVLVASIIYILRAPKSAEAEWFNDSWYYRQQFDVFNHEVSALTDFQVAISTSTLDLYTLWSNNKLNNDFSDLRFTDVHGNLLEYWFDSTTSTMSNVYVKYSSLPANSTSTLFMYYSNQSAVDKRDGDKVFEFFDDFSDSTKTSSKWTATGTGFTVTGGNLYHSITLEPTNSFPTYTIDDSGGFTNGVIESKMKPASCGASYGKSLVARYTDDNNLYIAGLEAWSLNYTHIGKRVSGSWTNLDKDSLICSTDTWYEIEWKLNDTSQSLDINDVVSTATDSAFSSGKVGVSVDNRETPTGAYWDWYLVRQYTATEPTITTTAGASEEKGPGPIAYWSFDEGYGTTAHDNTSNSNDGTISGATWQNEEQCIAGKCLYFDGDGDDSANCGNDSSLDITSAITMEAWIKPTGQGESGTPRIMSKGTSGDRAYGFLINLNEGVNSLEAWIGSSYQSSNNNVVSLNSWQHVVVTYSSSSQDTNFYVNGINVGTSNGASLESSVNDLIIGDMPSGGRAFNGQIDEVKVYPYARTEAQILTDYNAGLAGVGSASGVSVAMGGQSNKYLSDGLVGYWKMDEASWSGVADEVIDASGNGNHGVRGGDATTTSTAKYAMAGEFDGIDDYVDCGNSSSLDMSAENMVTEMAWIKLSSDRSKYGQIIRIASAYDMVIGTDDTLRYSPDGGAWISSEIAISENVWTHVAVVHIESNGSIYFYVDGILRATKSDSGRVIGSSGSLAIGAYKSNPSTYPFDGLIDEVRIYNRALSSREVRQLYEWAPGPVGYWKMDEKVSGNSQTLYDISGNENNGTTYYGANTTGMDCTAIGKYGSGCEFDGVDDYVNLGTHSELNTHSQSISAWIYVDDRDSPSIQGIITNGTTGGDGRYTILIESNKIAYAVSNGSTYVRSDSNSNIAEDTWVHLVAIKEYDGTNTLLKLYIDGVLQSDTETLSGLSSIVTPIKYIGYVNSDRYFNGLIDDVRIYNYARTQKQILEDMNGGRPAISSPVGYWSFDEGYGTTANDLGLGENNGTITGASSTSAGKFGRALSFDGDDYVTVDDSDFPDGAEPFSFSLWMKPLVTGTPFFYGTKSTNSGMVTYYDTNNSKTRFGRWGNDILTPTITQSLNEWSHIAYVYDGSTLSAYVNSSFAGSTTATLTTVLNASYIGSAGTSQYFSGSIDEVKIYNYALTEDEVRQEYNQGKAITLGSTGTESDGTTPSNSADRSYCVPGSTDSCSPPIAEWKFDEKTGDYAYDTSENNNTGTLTNMEQSDWTRGKIGSALEFDGDDEYINTGTSLGSTLNGSSGLTIEGWYNLDSVTTDDGLFTIRLSGDGDWFWNIRSGGTYFWVGYKTSGGDSYSQINNPFSGESGNWVHLVTTYSSGHLITYKNGVQIDDYTSATGTVGISTNAVTYLGTYATPSSWAADGKIDHVQIYDYARTPAQVAWDYNKGKPIGHWKFNEAEGGTIHDASNNLNHGTLDLGTGGNTVTSTAWQSSTNCKQGTCMDFDGTDDYVDTGMTLDTSEDTTITGWAITPDKSAYDINIISNGYGGGTNGFNFGLEGSIPRYWMSWADSVKYTVSADEITNNVWFHWVLVADGGTATYYVDGIAVDDMSYGTGGNNGKSVVIGARRNHNSPYNPQQYWNGKIDEVKIYNYALTSAQIQQDYNMGKGIYFK